MKILLDSYSGIKDTLEKVVRDEISFEDEDQKKELITYSIRLLRHFVQKSSSDNDAFYEAMKRAKQEGKQVEDDAAEENFPFATAENSENFIDSLEVISISSLLISGKSLGHN